MKIYAINNILNRNIAFKANVDDLNFNNIDEYLQANPVDINTSYKDMLDLNRASKQKRFELMANERVKNEAIETANVRWINPLDFYRRFNDEEYISRLIQTQSESGSGVIGSVVTSLDDIKSQYKKGTQYFSQNVPNSSFENTIIVPKLSSLPAHLVSDKQPAEIIKQVFLSFKEKDTQCLVSSINAFQTIAKNYFGFTSGKLKDIMEMNSTANKWVERIPIMGLPRKLIRVSEQQEAVNYLYQDYNEFCNKFVHKGIRPIVLSYVEKIRKTEIYSNAQAAYSSKDYAEFYNSAVENMKKIGNPLLDKYIKLLSAVTINGENLLSFYSAINKNGDISSIIKLLKTSLLLG